MKQKKRSAGTRGEHCVSVHISYELKQELKRLAGKYDRTTADVVRVLLRIGIPLLDGLSEAEELLIKEYIKLSRRYRQMRALKDG